MRTCITFGLLMAISGCGMLKVDVAVLDPLVLAEARTAQAAGAYLPVVLGETQETLASRVESVRAQHRSCYEDLANLYKVQAESLDPSDPNRDTQLSIAQLLLPDFDRSQEEVYEKFGARLESLRSKIVELTARIEAKGTSEDARSNATSARAGRLMEYRALVEGIALYVATDTNAQVSNAQTNLGAISEAAEQAASESAKEIDSKAAQAGQALRPTVKVTSLAGSPFAYAVASAPDSRWHSRFNQAVGRGIWGSVDVAIVMNPADSEQFPGSYSVKGMTFNPSDAIAATGKILTQGLILVAQANGVPVTASADATKPGSALAASSSRLQQAQDTFSQKEQRLAAYRDALLTIANSILAEQAHLESDTEAVRQGAITAIEARYTAQKDRLTEGSNP